MAKAKEAKKLEPTIQGIGPIKEPLTLPLPEAGGLVTLSGTHGLGKSTVLRTIEALLGQKTDLSVNDDSAAGKAEGFGAILTVGKSTRRSGEAVFSVLDGRFTIADLADPGISDPEARNRHRIKALLQLAGARADITLFDQIVDPDDRAVVLKPETFKRDDLIALANSIKRDLEAAARQREGEADNFEGQALAAKQQAEGIDTKVEVDPVKLQKAVEKAIREQQAIKSRERAYVEADAKRALAEEKIAEAAAGYTGLSVPGAKIEESTAKMLVDTTAQDVEFAKDALAKANAEAEKARLTYSAAIAARKAAESHESSIAAWREALAGSLPECPDQAEAEHAKEALEMAHSAIEAGTLARKAKESLIASEDAIERATASRKKATQHREAAKATDQVLSDAVSRVSSRLTVGTGKQAGWLVVTTDRGTERFDDLSEGEQIREALAVAITAVGAGGVLTIPQSFFEQLSPATREQVDAQLREQKVIGFTAVVTNEPRIAARMSVETEFGTKNAKVAKEYAGQAGISTKRLITE